MEPKSQALEKSPPASRAGKPAVAKEEEAFSSTGSPAGGDVGQGQLRSGENVVLAIIRKHCARHTRVA